MRIYLEAQFRPKLSIFSWFLKLLTTGDEFFVLVCFLPQVILQITHVKPVFHIRGACQVK